MTIDFSSARWDSVKENYGRWWDGSLKRPLIRMFGPRANPGRKESKVKLGSNRPVYDLSISAADVVDAWDWQLSNRIFYGDAFPSAWPNMGPGVLAAFLGARPVPADDTVWFEPEKSQDIGDIRLRFDPENVWLKRCIDLCRAAGERWEGRVATSMTDLGGGLDVVSTFRPSEQLPLDLYDSPEEVKRLTWETHEAWWLCFDEINKVLHPVNPGYTAWLDLFSEDPYYVLQCDFCYMIGPDMFDEFVRPELAASARRLGNAYYHLDGVGELPHLDSLLSIEEIKGIQWVYGAGKPGIAHWPEVYRKIRDTGKTIWVSGTLADFDTLVGQLGSADGIAFSHWVSNESDAEVGEFLRKYKVI